MPYEMTKAELDAVNACGHYLSVDVLRRDSLTEADPKSATSKSASADGKRIYLVPCPRGNYDAKDIERLTELDTPFTLLEIVTAPLRPSAPHARIRIRLQVKGETRQRQAGCNFVYSSDSRFREVYGAPVSVHDHIEGGM